MGKRSVAHQDIGWDSCAGRPAIAAGALRAI